MSKKPQIQLQTEINNDEEWDKFMLKSGLLLVDIYSEWCGPCSAMQAALKKIKLETGDLLQLATAKCDEIKTLKRFRNNCEPTWMFISRGKMVNIMFGANSPHLMRLILEELKKEETFIADGTMRGCEIDPSDLAPEEMQRKAVTDVIQAEDLRIDQEKKAKEILEWRTEFCGSILASMGSFGVVIIMPHAKSEAPRLLGGRYDSAALKVRETVKMRIPEDILEELFFFAEEKIDDHTLRHLLSDLCLVQLIKSQDDAVDVENELLTILYGPDKSPPGIPDTPNFILTKTVSVKSGNQSEEEEQVDLMGVWTPPNALTKAMALKFLFLRLAEQYIPQEPERTPPYIAIGFDAFKRREAMQLMDQYPKTVMRYGFFTKDVPEEAQLIAKSNKAFENRKPEEVDYTEKLVLQLSKKNSEAFQAFTSLGATHKSPNSLEGERECKIFFPEDYDEPDEEELAAITCAKKKKKGKKGKVKAEAIAENGEPEAIEEHDEAEDEEQGDADGDDDGETVGDDSGDIAEGETILQPEEQLEQTDKATSACE